MYAYSEGRIKPDEEISCDQHNWEVYCDGRLEKEGLEERCGVGNEKQEEGWKVGCKKLIHDASFEDNFHLDSIWVQVRIYVVKSPTLMETKLPMKQLLKEKIYLNVVLSQFNLGEHLNIFWLKLYTFSVKPFQLEMHKTDLTKKFSVQFCDKLV